MPNKRTKTTGGTSVMENRVTGKVLEDSDLQALQRRLDYFPTPPWATRAGAEVVHRLDPSARSILEPACGEGHMSLVLGERFDVIASDVFPHQAGTRVRDWRDAHAWGEGEADWLMTNPPFALAAEFVRHGLVRARHGVALLLRLAFLETVDRYALFTGDNPLTLLAVFCERVPMTLGAWKPDAASATAYGWFFWQKDAAPLPPIWLPPGTRDRLWRRDDPARYGWSEPMTLFEEPVPLIGGQVGRLGFGD